MLEVVTLADPHDHERNLEIELDPAIAAPANALPPAGLPGGVLAIMVAAFRPPRRKTRTKPDSHGKDQGQEPGRRARRRDGADLVELHQDRP